MRPSLPPRFLGIRLRRPFYGWYIVGMAYICLFLQAGTGGFAFGIFLPAMSADLGWSSSTIVLASSLMSITSALAGPLLGRVVDLHGPRLVLIASILVMGGAIAVSGLVAEPWQFYLTFGVLSGTARSAIQGVIPSALIASWFQRRRATAYGIAAMGPPTSNFLLPPLLTALVSSFGWRTGWVGLGCFGIAIALLPAIVLVRRRPEDLGLQPDGDPAAVPAAPPAGLAAAPPRSDDWTAREAIHSPAFWTVSVAMALILLAPNISIIFMFSYLSSKGMDPTTAAVALSAVSGMQVLSRLLFWAPVISRVGSVRWMLILWGGILLVASLLLALAEGEIWAYIAAVVLGLGLGGNLVLQLQVWPEYFGRTAIGTIVGTGHLVQGLTSAVAPLLLATLLDRTASYTALYLIVAAVVLIGIVLHLMVGKPQRPAAPVPAAAPRGAR